MPLMYFRKKKIVEAIGSAFNYDPYWTNVSLYIPFDGSAVDVRSGASVTDNGMTFNTITKKVGTHSGNFSGSSLLVNDTNAFNFGTSDFTIECWIYPTSAPWANGTWLFISSPAGGVAIGYLNATTFGIASNGGAWILSSTNLPPRDHWTHLAITRQNSNLRMFYNGNLITSVTSSFNWPSAATYIGHPSASYTFPGLIDELRITRGIARYTSNFTPATTSFLTNSPPNWDADWGKTVLLLNGDGLNNGTNNTFLDNSSNSLSVASSGNAAQGTYSPFSIPEGYWSTYFDGVGDYSSLLPSSILSMGTANFTIEAWVKFNTIGNGMQSIVGQRSGSNYFYIGYFGSDTSWHISNNSAGTLRFANSICKAGEWIHVAVARVGSTVTLYLNGQAKSTLSISTTLGYANTTSFVGATDTDSNDFSGYISNLRVVKGAAVYTSNFNPPLVPLTAISGTSLLTCASNRLIDISSSALNITVTGNVVTTTETPFNNPNEAVFAQNSFNSIYFDGTGDRVTWPASANWNLGNTYTIEFWLNYETLPVGAWGRPLLIGSNGTMSALCIQVSTAGNLGLSVPNSGINNYYLGTGTVITTGWQHIACVNNGGTATIYRNGVVVANGPLATQDYSASNPLYLGYDTVGTVDAQLKGLISNLRIVKGTAVYTSAFTPPTKNLTAIANTVLLTGQHDSIRDGSSFNAVPTITGNTKASQYSPFANSSSVGSVFFDGTNDYLTVAPAAINNAGTFTIEGWFNFSAPHTFNTIFSNCPAGTDVNYFHVYIPATNLLRLQVRDSVGQYIVDGTKTINPNTWYHIALTRSGTTFKIYVNGVLDVTGVSSKVITNRNLLLGGFLFTGFETYIGKSYVSNFRTSKTVRYASNFTPAKVVNDANTLALLNFNNGQIVDSTCRSVVETIGSTKVSTTQIATGTGSIYFNGTTDMIKVNVDPSQFSFGNRDFTIEAWIYPTSSVQGAIISFRPNASVYGPIAIYKSSSNTLFGYMSSTNGGWELMNTATMSTAMTLNSWNHVAICKIGTAVTTYINGVGTTITLVSSTLSPNTSAIFIGADGNGSNYFQGYMDDIRITKGFARYNTNFFPRMADLPAKQLTNSAFDPYWNNVTLSIPANDGNTTLADRKNHVLTSGAGVAISTERSRFGTSSLKFGGTLATQLVRTAAKSEWAFGTGSFTIEFWYNQAATVGTAGIIGSEIGYLSGGYWCVRANQNHSNTMGIVINDTGGQATYLETPTGSLTNNLWHHIAIVRDSENSQLRIFLNGTLSASVAFSNTVSVGSASYGLLMGDDSGYLGNGRLLNGYVEDLRITKGVARYLTTLTIPSSSTPTV